jgi:uridine kinase
MSEQVLVVGIGGGSGAGKSTLADNLVARFPGTGAVLPVDAYYRDLSHLPPSLRSRQSFDTPEAFDRRLLFEHVARLRRRCPVDRPVYSFSDHARSGRTVPLGPVDLLVIEGLFALYWPQLLAAYDLAVFLEAADEVRLQRRLARDTAARGRTPASVLRQYTTQTQPMYVCHVLPTRSAADLVLDGAAPIEANAARILEALAARPRFGNGPPTGTG